MIDTLFRRRAIDTRSTVGASLTEKVRFWILIGGCLVLASCGKGQETRKLEDGKEVALNHSVFLTRESPFCRVSCYVNDEPVQSIYGDTVGELELTPFIIHGDNSISVVSECMNQDISKCRYCKSELVVRTYSNGEFHEVVKGVASHKEASLGRVVKKWTFDIDVPVQWYWQSGEMVVSLGKKDREAILKMYNGFVDALRKKDWARAQDMLIPCWSNDRRPIPSWVDPILNEQAFADTLRMLTKAEKYGVYNVPVKNLRIQTGRRVVKMSPAMGYGEGASQNVLISIGKGANAHAASSTFRIIALYFVRVNGEWKMFLADWWMDRLYGQALE
jgi:hypothetical protein